MYVPKNDILFAIFCAGFPPYFFLNIKLPFWDIDGKTSELSQDRRPNHQERHQSYAKTGGQTTRKDIRVTPRQEAKPPGKTSELSQDRRQNHQERHQSYLRTGDVRELRHLCGIFWLGWFMDVGRSEGVAASMWHILVRLVYGCREI